MIEAHVQCAFSGDRTAETHPAKQGKLRTPLQQQANDLQKIFIPAHGNAIFGHPAETSHHSIIQWLTQGAGIIYWRKRHTFTRTIHTRQFSWQRFDFQAINTNHHMPIIHQMMRQRITRRPHTHHQHTLARVSERVRATNVERIPAREQAVNFKAPGQRQHVFQGARFRLRNIHRLLFLIDARLHAVIANTVTRGGDHGIVHDNNRQRTQRKSAGLDLVKLRNFFFQRATSQSNAECAFLERRRHRAVRLFFLAQTMRTRVSTLLVTPNAIVCFAQGTGQIRAFVGQRKTFARAQMAISETMSGIGNIFHRNDRHELLKI